MRFPYTEGGVTPPPPTPPSPLPTNAKTIISSQCRQPFRGGHAVRLPSDTSTAVAPLYTPYGYSEQMAAPLTSSTVGQYGENRSPRPCTTRWCDQQSVRAMGLLPVQRPRLHERGRADASAGLPARFVHQAVRRAGADAAIHEGGRVSATTFPVPSLMPPNPSAASAPSPPRPRRRMSRSHSPRGRPAVAQPHTYPYLVDKFFYSGDGRPGCRGDDSACRPGRGRGWPRSRRLVQDVRVLRGAQPVARGDRRGGPGYQLRLGKTGHETGAPQPEPDHRRGSLLQRSGLAVDHADERAGPLAPTQTRSVSTCSTSRNSQPAVLPVLISTSPRS